VALRERRIAERLVELRRYFPPRSEAEYRAALQGLNRILTRAPETTRAMGLKAYALVFGWLESWTAPGVTLSGTALLREALRIARRGVALAPHDYDGYWALGFVLLHSQRWREAESVFERGLAISDHNPNFMMEMADAMVHLGRPDRAQQLVRRARRIHDWHRWVAAWAHFMEAGRDALSYRLALEELDAFYRAPDDPHFDVDALLLKAAALHRLSQLRGTSQRLAKAQRAEAQRLLTLFRQKRPGFDLRAAQRQYRFARAADLEHWLGALRDLGVA
jgi:tetratricopeptide (TPR) repeat protein